MGAPAARLGRCRALGRVAVAAGVAGQCIGNGDRRVGSGAGFDRRLEAVGCVGVARALTVDCPLASPAGAVPRWCRYFGCRCIMAALVAAAAGGTGAETMAGVRGGSGVYSKAEIMIFNHPEAPHVAARARVSLKVLKFEFFRKYSAFVISGPTTRVPRPGMTQKSGPKSASKASNSESYSL